MSEPAMSETAGTGDTHATSDTDDMSKASDSTPTVELDQAAEAEPEPTLAPGTAGQLSCPTCGAEVLPGDGFCESCGADLMVRRAAPPDAAPARCPDCGGTSFTDGYCDNCGRLAPSPRDRIERDLGTVAGVSDRGLRHSRNEDAMAFAVIGREAGRSASVVVVCDGVSTSTDPQLASQLAAEAALEVPGARAAPRRARRRLHHRRDRGRAARRHRAGRGLPGPHHRAFLHLRLRGGRTGTRDVGWVGDSRVYWLAANGGVSRRLTEDDTWAGQLIAGGAVEEGEAYKAPHAHAILRWLGPDAPQDPPHVQAFVPEGPGLVLACSDGLWNYVWGAGDLADIVWAANGPQLPTPLAAGAVSLTAVALDGGGQDNITTVLAAYPSEAEAVQSDKGMGIAQ